MLTEAKNKLKPFWQKMAEMLCQH